MNETIGQGGFRVAVIGAGMSGVLMAIRLRQAGIDDITVYEKGDRVGGTWRENSYPGLRCDVPSHHYCYSFDPNPEWTNYCSSGAEIRQYFEDSATRFGVMDRIRFNTAVIEGRWGDGQWHIKLSDGSEDKADVLISAAGILHIPAYPAIAGISTFEGAMFHTARWDHSVALEDKRVGIIGTGSTAAQVIAELAGKTRHFSIFQRTPQWVIQVPNPRFSVKQKKRFRAYPFLLRWHYEKLRMQLAALMNGAIMGKDPMARQALEAGLEANLATVHDPELREKLRPDYLAGCKRLVMSPNFYEAVQRPNTDVVTAKIDRIEPDGLRTADGRLHPLDVIILATGFDPNAFLRPVKLYGRNGRSLDDVWAERPVAYHSMAVPDMPNFFMLEGPFSPIGNLSVVLISEWQADYVMRCVELARRERVALSPTPEATDVLMKRYRAAAKDTIWATGGCQSWYQDEEGVPIIYPFSPDDFRAETNGEPNRADFVIDDLARADA